MRSGFGVGCEVALMWLMEGTGCLFASWSGSFKVVIISIGICDIEGLTRSLFGSILSSCDVHSLVTRCGKVGLLVILLSVHS
jgi:hypothetical protein